MALMHHLPAPCQVFFCKKFMLGAVGIGELYRLVQDGGLRRVAALVAGAHRPDALLRAVKRRRRHQVDFGLPFHEGDLLLALRGCQAVPRSSSFLKRPFETAAERRFPAL